MNNLSLAVNKLFYILSYALCVALLLLGMYIKSLSIFALLIFSSVSLNLLLSILKRRNVTFYRQGMYYRTMFGLARYVPLEHIHYVDVLSVLGLNITQVKLNDGKRWFFTFKLHDAQLEQLAAMGYRLRDTSSSCAQS